jgi:hypothetical protein
VETPVDREPPENHDGNRVRHIPSDSTGGLCVRNRACRQSVIAHDL